MEKRIKEEIAFWASVVIANMGFMTGNKVYGMIWIIFAIIIKIKPLRK